MDIYDIAVKLALINGVSGGLNVIVNQFTNVRAGIRNTQNVLQSFQMALGTSVAWRGGKEILRGMSDIVAAGGAVLDQQALMLAAGWQQKDVAEMTAAAYRAAASVMAATPASALAAERTLLGIFGNVREAQAALPAFLQAEAVMTAAGRGAGAGRQLTYGLKALDIQGAFVDRKTGEFSVAAYRAGMHELLALMLAIPHTLDMNQLVLFTRMAGPAAQAMSFQDYARTYDEVIASMGRTGGRGLQMLYKTFLGGNISKALADQMIKAGLVQAGAIRHIKGSSRDILDYHGIVGWQELTTNAADWAHDVRFPLLAKHGFQGVPGLMQAMGSLPVTVQRLLSFLLTNWAQVERGTATIERAENADSYKESAQSFSLNVKNFEAAWGGLMQALGAPGAQQIAIPLLQLLTRSLKGLSEFLEDHPDFAYELDVLGGAIGGILLVRGLRTGIKALRGLGAALPLLARGLGMFAAGEAAELGLAGLLTGVPELAIALIGLGLALKPIVSQMTANDPLHRAEPEKRISDAIAKAHAEADWRMTHGGSLVGFHYTPPPVPPQYRPGGKYAPHPGGLPLPPPYMPEPLPLPPPPPPPPPASNVHVTLHSPISLPIPPLSETDIEAMFRRAIYSRNEALLKELARQIVAQQQSQLLPVIEDAIRQMQVQRRRATFIDVGHAHAGTVP